jgi:hypothetical protein
MSTTITGIGQSKVINNLDTYIHTTALTSMYTISMMVSERPVSGIIITLQHNGSTVASTSAPTAPALAPNVTGAGSGTLTAPTTASIGQQLVQLSATINCTAGDTISAIVSSSTAHDSKPNDFKGILNIRPGTI